jgi:hypothetical protein
MQRVTVTQSYAAALGWRRWLARAAACVRGRGSQNKAAVCMRMARRESSAGVSKQWRLAGTWRIWASALYQRKISAACEAGCAISGGVAKCSF